MLNCSHSHIYKLSIYNFVHGSFQLLSWPELFHSHHKWLCHCTLLIKLTIQFGFCSVHSQFTTIFTVICSAITDMFILPSKLISCFTTNYTSCHNHLVLMSSFQTPKLNISSHNALWKTRFQSLPQNYSICPLIQCMHV